MLNKREKMIDSLGFTRDVFLECDWKYDVSPESHYGYSSVMCHLQKSAREKAEAGHAEQFKVLDLLGRAASMRLTPDSINEPFKAYFQDFQEGRRSAIPEDFTSEELSFFEVILNVVNEPWLRARIADLLWLLRKPKNPDHAKIAIESYISHVIDSDTWRRGVNDCLERAARLCIQIKDFNGLEEIKAKLFSAFCSEYPRSKFMSMWIADLLDKLKIDQDFQEDIAASLHKKAEELRMDGDFNSARSYFALAAKKYQQCSDETDWLKCIIAIADCFELEADSRSGSNIVANSFYENAIQAYRRIPVKHRGAHSVESKLAIIRKKITESGKASLDEMGLIEIPGIDISEMAKASIEHVAGKFEPQEALIYFAGLSPGPNYEKLVSSAKEIIKQNPISNLFGSTIIGSDGRVVAKIPPMNMNADETDQVNKSVLNRNVQQGFVIQVQLLVEGQILPALRQLLKEHRFTKDLMVDACHQSPIVPQDRKHILGYALWLGFEYEFGIAIHLLCPQVEHIVRTLLKEAGSHTSNIDKDGIENENGLSSLMDLPEVAQVFGPDLAFEIKSIFTESLGFNLRNQVAHGLLSDNSSSSLPAVYAWWMVIRLIIRSITHGGVKNANHVAAE